MTQILTAACPNFIVQMSDRLVVAKRGEDIEKHDPIANKTVVYRATDALATIGFSGIAYIGSTPTDQWIAEVLRGEKLDRPDGLGFGQRLGGSQRVTNIGAATRKLKAALEALPSKPVDDHGLELVIAGWQAYKTGSRPILVNLKRLSGKTSLKRASRHWPENSNFLIDAIGVMPGEGVLQQHLAPFKGQSGGPLQPEHLEKIFLDIIRATSKDCVTVGSNVLSVVLFKPGLGPAGCQFFPLDRHAARVVGKNMDLEVEVAHSPWIIGPGLTYAPCMEIGHCVLSLGGLEFHILGAKPNGPFNSLSSSIRRRPPPR